MADTSLSIAQIELGLARYFDVRANVIVTNLSYGMLNHEADIVVMSKAGYLTEVEIKRSYADFIADFRKRHHHEDDLISWYYFAVPQAIAEKCAHKLQEVDSEKKWGLLCYDDEAGECYVSCAFHPANKNIHLKYKQLSLHEQFQFARLGALRQWSLKEKIIKIKNK